MKIWLYCLLLAFTCSAQAESMTQDGALDVKQITQFSGIPWGITLLNDEQAIVTIKKGELYKVDLKTGEKTAISGLPVVDNRGQGGLLDVATPTPFKPDSWLYFSYAKPTNEGATTTLARAKIQQNTLVDWQDIFVADAATSFSRHFGGRIAFDDQDHVFLTIGDRGKRDSAQDLTNHAGCIVRLYLDGRIPSDNPFVGNPVVDDAIWSYGHRNPQGLYYDKEEHKLWSNEHGPKGGDEINLIRPGANYGWPIVSYGREYSNSAPIGEGEESDGIEKPLKIYVPSIAPSALLKYHGKLFADWNGNFLSTALALRHLNLVAMQKDNKTTEHRYLSGLNERFRAIAQDNEGTIYLTTDSGKLLAVSLKQATITNN